jgi:nitrogen fixation/metabolism regulation signal transduction histidine kinase
MLKLEDASFENLALSALVNKSNLAILEKLLGRAKRGGQAAEQTILAREHTADGGCVAETSENLPVALTATVLPKTAEGQSSGVVLVIEDLTELLNAQRASAWAEVARRMAHEIKNPLTPIQLSAERIAKRFAQIQSPKSKVKSFLESFTHKTDENLLPDKNQLANVVSESTETILREVSSLKAMVDEFARFARLPDVKLENKSVNDVIKQAIALYEDRFDNVRIEIDLAENLPNAMIDEEQLRRVFVNLIENSIEAFDDTATPNKQISVCTRHDEARDLIVAEISDNGSGIAPQGFQKLFQPYFSTKGRGTGLGLAIVRRIIIEHAGKIRASANVPKGARFIIELPVTS